MSLSVVPLMAINGAPRFSTVN